MTKTKTVPAQAIKAAALTALSKEALTERLLAASSAHSAALSSKAEAEAALTQAKREFALAESTAILSGVITGKNEQERKASARTTLVAEISAVEAAEDAADAAAHELAQSKLEWDLARELVKVAQLQS